MLPFPQAWCLSSQASFPCWMHPRPVPSHACISLGPVRWTCLALAACGGEEGFSHGLICEDWLLNQGGRWPGRQERLHHISLPSQRVEGASRRLEIIPRDREMGQQV